VAVKGRTNKQFAGLKLIFVQLPW